MSFSADCRGRFVNTRSVDGSASRFSRLYSITMENARSHLPLKRPSHVAPSCSDCLTEKYGSDTDRIPTDRETLYKTAMSWWLYWMEEPRIHSIEGEVEELHDWGDPIMWSIWHYNPSIESIEIDGSKLAELRRTDAGFVDHLPAFQHPMILPESTGIEGIAANCSDGRVLIHEKFLISLMILINRAKARRVLVEVSSAVIK